MAWVSAQRAGAWAGSRGTCTCCCSAYWVDGEWRMKLRMVGERGTKEGWFRKCKDAMLSFIQRRPVIVQVAVRHGR